MKYSLENIIDLIVEKTGCSKSEISEQSDLLNDLGCCGDDFFELIDKFAKRFNVDMTAYLWYFHNEEEGHANSIGRIFFKAPYEKVKHIPVTPQILLESANIGKWIINYPVHNLPKRRYDIMVNMFLVIAFILFIIYKCFS